MILCSSGCWFAAVAMKIIRQYVVLASADKYNSLDASNNKVVLLLLLLDALLAFLWLVWFRRSRWR